MATYTVQSPDGKLITLQGPDGASHDDVIAQAQKLYQPAAKPAMDPVINRTNAQLQADVAQVAVPKRALQDAQARQAQQDKNTQAINNRVPLIHAPRATNPNISQDQAAFQNDQSAAKAQGASFNFSDELNSLGQAARTGIANVTGQNSPGYSAGDAYKATQAVQAGRAADYTAAHPVDNLRNQVVGGLMNPVNLVGGEFIGGAKTLGGGALRAGTVNGLLGAAYGAGEGQGAAKNAFIGAGTGAAIGGTLHVTGNALGAAANALPKSTKAPNLEQLTAAKNAAYQAVDNAGVAYTPEALKGMADNITNSLDGANLSAIRHPKAASMLADIQNATSQPMTLTQLDQLRQVVRRDVASAPDDAERYMGKQIINGIDDFVQKASPDQVASGNPAQAAALVNRARDLNTRVRKIETIQDAVAAAKLRAGSTGSGGNADNATRQNLRRVLERGTNFTPEEQDALEKIVVGGRTQNVLRLVGKLSPTGNGLMAGLELGAAGLGEAGHNRAVGAGAVAVGLTGLAAKTGADAMTGMGASRLTRQIASGAGLNTRQERVATQALLRLSSQAARSPQSRAAYDALISQLTAASGSTPPMQTVRAGNSQ